MRGRGTWLFAAGALAALSGLSLLSHRAVRDERGRNAAEAEARHQEDVRTSLFRMDQRFGPLLARAVARTERSGLVTGPTSFSVSLPDGVAIPEVEPEPLASDLLERTIVACEMGANFVPSQEAALPVGPEPSADVQTRAWLERGVQRSAEEFSNRFASQSHQNVAQTLVNDPQAIALLEEPLRTGPLVADWELDDEGAATLVLSRFVREGGVGATQSFRFAWDELEALLLAELEELARGAALERVAPAVFSSEEAYLGDCLATIPARLDLPRPAAPDALGDGLRTTLVSTWVLGVGALLALGFALVASQRDAERQRRFRSAVTHELRTPLTTFRMYADMLRSGMVPEERRDGYLRTLEQEAARLEGLVENVLAHARLEEGGAPPELVSLSVADLVEGDLEALGRRAEGAGTTLAAELGDAARRTVRTEPTVVSQILANLVDNACKYGAPAGGHRADAPVVLTARQEPSRVVLAVADEGPGVPRARRRAVFRPFDRGGRDESDAAPGVGLGLALSADLARAIGAELTLADSPSGARFELALPLVR